MPRPREAIRRPKHISIRGGIVRCRHRHCFYVSGPYLTRDEAALAARDHHRRIHEGRRS